MHLDSVKVTSLVVTLSALTSSCFKEPSFVKVGDYRFVQDYYHNELTQEQLGSLEEILEDPNLEEEKSESRNFTIDPPQYSQVVYRLSEKNTWARGTAFIVHKEGYFISACHIFESFLDRRKNGETDEVMMVYDPIHGFASPARVLAFSNRGDYDILLGKVDIKGDFPIKTIKIHETDTPIGNHAYAITHQNHSYLGSGLPKEIIAAGKFIQNDPYLAFEQRDLLLKQKEVGFQISIGKSLTISFPNGENFLDPWQAAFIAPMKEGNSGSPVFDLRNRFIGVVTSVLTGGLKSKNDEELSETVGIYTTSPSIVRMVKTYLDYKKEF